MFHLVRMVIEEVVVHLLLHKHQVFGQVEVVVVLDQSVETQFLLLLLLPEMVVMVSQVI
jgi:hypothetical protein